MATPPRLAATLFVLLAAVIAVLASDYGVAWDDAVQTEYGRCALNYFLSCGHDRSCNDWLDLRFYGPLVELPIAALSRAVPERLVEIRHLVCGAIALLAVPSLFRFGSLLGGSRTTGGDRLLLAGNWLGVLAVLFVWTMPRFFGHAFLNSKDIPFAIGMTASLTAMAEIFARGRFRWGETVWCGLLLGLTTAVRPGGWMLIGPYYVALCIFSDLWRGRTRKGRRHASGKRRVQSPRRRTLAKQGVLLTVAWVVMILPWPWAHQAPVSHPLQSMRMASKFHLVIPVLFEGRVFLSDDLPPDYLLKYLVFTTPLAVLTLATLGACICFVTLVRRPRQPRAIAFFTLLIWPALPLGLFVMMRPNTYDGLRHFLFVLPAIGLLAAVGITGLWTQCARFVEGHRASALAFASLGLAFVPQFDTLVRLHPYQMTYFNSAAGGMRDVEQRFETDYWLTSYKEAMQWIQAQAVECAAGDEALVGSRSGQRAPRVLVAANEHSRWCADYFADDRLQIETTLDTGQPGDLPAGFDYYVATSRSAMSSNFPEAQSVHVVGRLGATFAIVKCPRTMSRPVVVVDHEVPTESAASLCNPTHSRCTPTAPN